MVGMGGSPEFMVEGSCHGEVGAYGVGDSEEDKG